VIDGIELLKQHNCFGTNAIELRSPTGAGVDPISGVKHCADMIEPVAVVGRDGTTSRLVCAVGSATLFRTNSGDEDLGVRVT
jgi:hypothetical protein